MRTLALALALGLLSGCYLFSDEPKARKQAREVGAAGASAEGAEQDRAQGAPSEPAPTPATAVADCPELLTGVEAQARTIASSCKSVRVRGSYRVDGGSLSVEAGVELRFEPGATIEVGRDLPGSLTLAGTVEQPVRMVADSVSDSGGWRGLELGPKADGSVLRQVEIEGAGSSERAALSIAATQVQVEGLRVRGHAGLALELLGPRGPELLGVELSGVGVVARASPSAVAGLQELKLEPGAVVAIAGGRVDATLEWPPNPYRVEGTIHVEGEEGIPAQLSLAPGASLAFVADARLVIGGLGPGSLSASAGAPAPTPELDGPPPSAPVPPPLLDERIRFMAADDDRPGSWSGLHVQDQGRLILRNVELSGGGARDEGMILAEGSASLSVEGCRFVSSLVGVELRGAELSVETLANNEFVEVPAAIRTTPALVASLGADNRYDASAQIQVERGKIEASTSWAAHAAPIVIRGDLFVDAGATLTVAPGARLAFMPGVILGVGYYASASLDMRGSAEAPISLAPAPGSELGAPGQKPWAGVVLGAEASKVRFEHVRLRGTDGAAGIELREGADATLVNVDCAGCAGATVKWACDSTVGNIKVSASEGTPTALLAPSGC